jgi:hypothetical protein
LFKIDALYFRDPLWTFSLEKQDYKALIEYKVETSMVFEKVSF